MQAKINAKGIPVSTKDAINAARFIRGKELKKAKARLNDIAKKKISLPHLKYKRSSSHKKGKVMAGSYPIKTIKEIIKLLDGVEANARSKGMVAPFIVKHINADNGGLQWHYGRHRRHRRKNTNMKIILEEKKPEQKQERNQEEKQGREQEKNTIKEQQKKEKERKK